MHPVRDFFRGPVTTPTGALRMSRLAEPERGAGGARYAIRIAFDADAPGVAALLKTLEARREAALALGRARFARLPIEMRRRLREVAVLPVATRETQGGETRLLIRAERPARLGAPSVLRGGRRARLDAEPIMGAPVAVTITPLPRFAAGVAAAGLLLRLDAVDFRAGAAAPGDAASGDAAREEIAA